jgi:hypothetical protein
MRHNVLVEPVAEELELRLVLLIFFGSDVLTNAPTKYDLLIPW